MAIDERSPVMDQYLDRMVRNMKARYGVDPTNPDWLPVAGANLSDLTHSLTATGAEHDPYREAAGTENTETRWDRQFQNGYAVRWSPKRGVFYVYKDDTYVECYPTNY